MTSAVGRRRTCWRSTQRTSPVQTDIVLHHPSDFTKWRTVRRQDVELEALHVDVLREGKLVYDLPDLETIRATRQADVARLDSGVRRLINPHIYHVSLTETLWDLKQELIMRARGHITFSTANRQSPQFCPLSATRGPCYSDAQIVLSPPAMAQ